MSKPDFAKDMRFDKFLLNIVDTNQGIEGYFDAVFGVLGRSTDFFTREQQAFETVNAAMTKHIAQFKTNVQTQKALDKKQKEIAAKAKKEREQFLAEKVGKIANASAQVAEVSNEQAAQIQLSEAAKRAGVLEREPGEKEPEEEKKEESDEEGKGQKPNAGNGGQTEKYHWEQNLMEVTVYYYLPDGTSAKDLKIDMGIKHCRLQIKG